MTVARIGVLMGGFSAERAVSLKSGRAIAAALRGEGRDIIALDLCERDELFSTLRDAALDVAVLALHGRFGEDGCVQSILELLGVPYTGSGVMSSALAMDKLKSKELFRLHNVPTPPYYCLNREAAGRLSDAHGSFGFPVVVKPRREGSSIGVRKASSLAELASAVEEALGYDDSVVVERFVKAQEVAVGILDGRVLGAIEIAPEGGMYDYAAKYESNTTRYFMPARLPPARYRGVLNLAERAASALDCRGAVRVDLLVTEGQNEYVLEVNTIPGMTETSLLPKIAEAAGYSFEALCEAMLTSARSQASSGAATDRSQSKPAALTPLREAQPLRRSA